MLVHPRSREAFMAVIRFRNSLDPRDLVDTRRNNRNMWFDIIETGSTRDYKIFLDVGAFDGDTIRQAFSRLLIQRAIAVEANAALFPQIRSSGIGISEEVLIVPYAAWSHRCRLKATEVRGGMVSVIEADDGELEAAPIDESVNESVDLIKIDIEGAEINALVGLRSVLQGFPDLAIAAYHKPQDLATIPDYLFGHGYRVENFDLHVAHYSDCLDDTIIYFLRKQ